MELDLTRLNALATAPKMPPGDALSTGGDNSLPSQRNATEEGLEGSLGLKKLQREADQRRDEKERTLEIYKTYQRNSKASSELQTEILKGAAAGESAYSLLLKACQAISLMTSNKLFYEQIALDLKAIYGEGLGESYPLQLQLEETRGRLQKLETALETETAADSKARITKAIAAHRALVAELERKIERVRER